MAQLGHRLESSDFNNQLGGLNLLDKGTKLKETESLVLNDKDKKIYEGTEVKGIKGLLLCEDQSTKKMFLSDGYRLLTKQFDNIKNISKEGNDIYYIGVNGGKSTLYKSGKDIIIGEGKLNYRMRNGKMETVFEKDGYVTVLNDGPDQEVLSNVGDIDYRIIDGQLVTIIENDGKKTVRRGDEVLKENCEEAVFESIASTKGYNREESRKYVDDNISYAIRCVEKGGRWSTFINGKLYCSGTGYGKTTYQTGNGWFEANGSHIMIMTEEQGWTPGNDTQPKTVYYNGKPIGKLRFEGELIGMQSLIVKKNNGKYACLSLKTGSILGSEYDKIYAGGPVGDGDYSNYGFAFNEDRMVFGANKGGKDVLVVDGEDYLVDTMVFEPYELGTAEYIGGYQYDDIGLWFLKRGDKHYCMGKDLIAHEYEGEYDKIIDDQLTTDGKPCFIGEKGDKEVFVFDGKIMGKEYDHILGAGLLPGGGVYMQAERNGKKVFILNGTEREEPASLDKKTVLFSRNDNDY